MTEEKNWDEYFEQFCCCSRQSLFFEQFKNKTFLFNTLILKGLNGAQRWDRTTDTRIFSPLLYQLSYLGLN